MKNDDEWWILTWKTIQKAPFKIILPCISRNQQKKKKSTLFEHIKFIWIDKHVLDRNHHIKSLDVHAHKKDKKQTNLISLVYAGAVPFTQYPDESVETGNWRRKYRIWETFSNFTYFDLIDLFSTTFCSQVGCHIIWNFTLFTLTSWKLKTLILIFLHS